MWAANQALNGLIGAGIAQDWASHYIGHALTALYGIDHARTLSVVMPSVLRFRIQPKQAMLARYARNVWDVAEADDRKAAGIAIERTEDFFRRMGLPVSTREVAAVSADDVVGHLEKVGHTALGEDRSIGVNEVREILRISAAA
jgi:NADP-dependent alcohol dehydrogenase